jgi:hypothetical protein
MKIILLWNVTPCNLVITIASEEEPSVSTFEVSEDHIPEDRDGSRSGIARHVHGRSSVRISAGTSAIMTEVSPCPPQYFQAPTGIVP